MPAILVCQISYFLSFCSFSVLQLSSVETSSSLGLVPFALSHSYAATTATAAIAMVYCWRLLAPSGEDAAKRRIALARDHDGVIQPSHHFSTDAARPRLVSCTVYMYGGKDYGEKQAQTGRAQRCLRLNSHYSGSRSVEGQRTALQTACLPARLPAYPPARMVMTARGGATSEQRTNPKMRLRGNSIHAY